MDLKTLIEKESEGILRLKRLSLSEPLLQKQQKSPVESWGKA